MQSTRIVLGVSRSLIGLGSWLAPDTTMRVFGIDPVKADRFVGRLFGARELALAVTLLSSPPVAVRQVATVGAVVDAVDALAGFDERRRGTIGTRATLLGPVGALMFVVLGVIVARDAGARSSA